MKREESALEHRAFELSPVNLPGAFSRIDESDDRIFYAKDRFVDHLDAEALTAVQQLIADLVVEDRPVVLDLMAGWNSHLPKKPRPARAVGLGLNRNELAQNQALTEYLLHDLNADPHLPFPDATFDVVLNTVSIDYIVHPFTVFSEVGRVLKPGGLFLVVFSNRMFPEKAVKVWLESSEDERVLLVEEFFAGSGLFEPAETFLSRGKPRPKDDKYADSGLPSDPVYAVYAERKGASVKRKRSRPVVDYRPWMDPAGLPERERAVKQTMCCPHCGEKLRKWAVPDNPFVQTWDNDHMHICFNDACPYYVRGWNFMYREGNHGISYRLMYNPVKDRCMPIPVPSPNALRDGIVEGEEPLGS
jgi:SAM-dependent methyltransferase